MNGPTCSDDPPELISEDLQGPAHQGVPCCDQVTDLVVTAILEGDAAAAGVQQAEGHRLGITVCELTVVGSGGTAADASQRRAR